MAWTVWWALVFGFAISALAQAWIARGARPLLLLEDCADTFAAAHLHDGQVAAAQPAPPA